MRTEIIVQCFAGCDKQGEILFQMSQKIVETTAKNH